MNNVVETALFVTAISIGAIGAYITDDRPPAALKRILDEADIYLRLSLVKARYITLSAANSLAEHLSARCPGGQQHWWQASPEAEEWMDYLIEDLVHVKWWHIPFWIHLAFMRIPRLIRIIVRRRPIKVPND